MHLKMMQCENPAASYMLSKALSCIRLAAVLCSPSIMATRWPRKSGPSVDRRCRASDSHLHSASTATAGVKGLSTTCRALHCNSAADHLFHAEFAPFVGMPCSCACRSGTSGCAERAAAKR